MRVILLFLFFERIVRNEKVRKAVGCALSLFFFLLPHESEEGLSFFFSFFLGRRLSGTLSFFFPRAGLSRDEPES